MKYTYLSQKELIARLVGYSSRATALFTGILKIRLQGIVNAKYELGLLNGAIVFCKGQKNAVPLYGNTALRALVEDLSNPNITGDLSFIENKPYEVEAQVVANPLIALQTPVYFEDLSTLVLADVGLAYKPITKKPAPILHRSRVNKSASSKNIKKPVLRKQVSKQDIPLKRISDDDLFNEYSNILRKYLSKLIDVSKYMGILTAKSPRDLGEMLSKYSDRGGLIIAHINSEHGLTKCTIAVYKKHVLGVYCQSAGLELRDVPYTQPFIECNRGCNVELYEIRTVELENILKDKLLYVLDSLDNGIYHGVIQNNSDITIRYYTTLYNGRITRLSGTIVYHGREHLISPNIARNVLINILLSSAKNFKPLGTRDLRKIKKPWTNISTSDWKHAITIAHKILEYHHLLSTTK